MSPTLGAIVMTDHISCPTNFPKDKTEHKVDSLNIYCETLSQQGIHEELFTFTNLQHSPKSSHLHNLNLNKKSVSDFHICKKQIKAN